MRPTGQVTLDRSLSGGLSDATEGSLRDALTEWVRVDGVTGHYFDDRSIRDEYVGQHVSGQMKNAGVPGASWLALMALPMLPVRTTQSGKAATVGFQRRRGELSTFRWPVWRQPLDPVAVRALLDHPGLTRVDRTPEDKQWRVSRTLDALGIDAVFVAERRPGPQGGDGALGPASVLVARRNRRAP